VKRRPLLWALLLLLLLGGTAGYWWRQAWLEQSQDAPIRAAARHYGVEPALVKAIVWRESRFHPHVRGQAGELGLMQIQQPAAQEWANAEHIKGFEHETCLDPATNTLAGAYYLKRLLKRYTQADNPLPYALADYNAGRGNILKWNTGPAATNSSLFIQQIGFPGTRDYVRSVLRRYEKYRTVFLERDRR
jgi:soluble lytic murein transglycosylase